MGTKIVDLVEMSSGLMKQKIELFGHNDHGYVWRKGGGLQAEEYLRKCFAAGGTGALHKIDGIMR